MIGNFEIGMWIIGVLLLIIACIAANKDKKGITTLAFIVGGGVLSVALLSGGMGFSAYAFNEYIPINQLYLLESDIINSYENDKILVLMTPIPIEAVQINVTRYKTEVLKKDAFYYKIPKGSVSLGLVKGDIAIKKDGKLQKFRPTEIEHNLSRT